MNIFLKRFLLLFLVIGAVGISDATANATDSLFQVIKTSPQDTNRVNDLVELCWLLHRTDIDEMLDLANESLNLSKELDFKTGVGNSYKYISWAYISKSEFDKALKFAYKAAEVAEEIGNDKLYNSAYNDIARIYSEMGKSDEALKIWQNLIDIDEKKSNPNPGDQSVNYLNVAILLVNNHNNKEARKYFMRALEIAKDADQSMIKSAVHMEIAEMYIDEGNMDEAENNFSTALKISEPGGDLWVSAFSTLGLSKINLIKGNKEFALMQARDALQLAEQIGDVRALVSIKNELAKVLRKMGRYNEALQLGFEVINTPEGEVSDFDKIDLYSEMSQSYKEIGNYKQAYVYSKKHHALQDSISAIEKAQNVLEIEKKYQSELKETENKALKTQQVEQEILLTQKNYLNNALFFILFLLGAVSFMIYKNNRAKICAQVILEEKVKERTEELRLSNKKLQKSNVELERFAHIASHDLREPLRNISGFAGLLRKELNPESGSNTEEYLDFITNNTLQLNILIQDILVYSKLNQEKIQERTTSFNPNLIIDNISKKLSESIRKKKVKIFVKGQLPMLNSTGQQVYFLFKNLIENGIKYNKSDFPRIDILCLDKGENYEFLIRDNGIGISPEFTVKIFEMFTRLHNREKFEGTGLGLSFCQKIVENHGGKIWVESIEGKGSSFIFTWPKALTTVESKMPKVSTKETNTFILAGNL